MTSPLPVMIVGAGIGGLAAAIALRRAGVSVEVHERAGRLSPVGAGLTVQPNATLALRKLGLGERVEQRGVALGLGGLWRWDGAPISVLAPERAARLLAGLEAPILGMHRATLHELLLDALGREHVRLGHACSGFEARADRVLVRFEDGSTRDCAALIGADGLHSVVRAQLFGPNEPVYAGYTSWRGVTTERCGLPEGFGGELWGRGTRFGGCCIDGGRYYWFAVANAARGERDPDPGRTKAALLARFSGWGKSVPALIESTPDSAILRTDIADRPPLSRWGEGLVTLLGDAAHPMTPNLGQGACQAIEDALVLGRALANGAALEPALRSYEGARSARANQVVIAARRLGAIGQWQSAFACGVRNRLFAAIPTRAVERQLRDGWALPYA